MCSRKVMQLLLGKRPKLVGILQRYYPQCAACSGKQSAAVKASMPVLVLHYYGMRPWYYAGGLNGTLLSTCFPVRLVTACPLRWGPPLFDSMDASLALFVHPTGAFVGLRHYSSPGDLRTVRRR